MKTNEQMDVLLDALKELVEFAMVGEDWDLVAVIVTPGKSETVNRVSLKTTLDGDGLAELLAALRGANTDLAQPTPKGATLN